MNKNDSLGDRMKGYENVSRNYLTRRVPVLIRLDGKAFHSFTKGMQKPFDRFLMTVMQETMLSLCKEIQGCVFGYTQSDEITLVLTDYKTIKTDAWFGYNIQKMASVSASIATLEFNRIFREKSNYVKAAAFLEGKKDESGVLNPEDGLVRRSMLLASKYNKALFDSRCFSVPEDEVCNCLIWRQQDATRNSIEAAGQANFSHSELHGKSCNEIQDMLFTKKGINWNDYPTDFKRGAACYRVNTTVEMPDRMTPGNNIEVTRRIWTVDCDIPVFSQDRDFVEKWL